jgi:hypothetical protein
MPRRGLHTTKCVDPSKTPKEPTWPTTLELDACHRQNAAEEIHPERTLLLRRLAAVPERQADAAPLAREHGESVEPLDGAEPALHLLADDRRGLARLARADACEGDVHGTGG